MEKITPLCLSLMAIILAIDSVIPLGVATDILYIGVVLLSLRHPRKVFTIQIATLCSLLTIAGYFLSPPGGELLKALGNRVLILFAIWVTAVMTLQRKQLEEERAQAFHHREKALKDIKILRGFLPICASCKKIRDDQGYWSQIEEYIQAHSEADFSHGLCPDCARKLYPEFFNDGKPGSNTVEEKGDSHVTK